MTNLHVQTRAMMALMVLLCAGSAAAEVETKTIEYEHDGVTLEGYLAWDASSDERRPGVLIVHEWWGHDDYVQRRAREVAELGYVAFALDMYGKDVHTDSPAEAQQLSGRLSADGYAPMRRRARAGLDVLADQDMIDSDRLAAMGYCFGGTVSLQLAYDRAPVQGVISFHGSLPAPAAGEAEQIDASILVLHGAADPFVPDRQVTQFKSAMEDGDVDWHFISYGHAVHSFTNPTADEHGIDGSAYNERADRRSWRHMKGFLDELFES